MSGFSAVCGCLLLYRGENKYAVAAVCVAGRDEFAFRAQASLCCLVSPHPPKIIKISLEEQMLSRPLLIALLTAARTDDCHWFSSSQYVHSVMTQASRYSIINDLSTKKNN